MVRHAMSQELREAKPPVSAGPREFLLYDGKQTWVIRRDIWCKPGGDPTIPADQELFEIPKDFAVSFNHVAMFCEALAHWSVADCLGPRCSEASIERVLVLSFDRELGEDRELHVIGAGAKG